MSEFQPGMAGAFQLFARYGDPAYWRGRRDEYMRRARSYLEWATVPKYAPRWEFEVVPGSGKKILLEDGTRMVSGGKKRTDPEVQAVLKKHVADARHCNRVAMGMKPAIENFAIVTNEGTTAGALYAKGEK